MEAFEISEELRGLIAALPDLPGVYIMKDNSGAVIYVGKAVSLKNRVRQYFQSPKTHSAKTAAMVKRIARFETIVTDNEVGSSSSATSSRNTGRITTSCSRTTKNFPYVRIDMREDFPRVEIVRRRKNDGAQYYGPFVSSGALKGGPGRRGEDVSSAHLQKRTSPARSRAGKRLPELPDRQVHGAVHRRG